MAPSPVTAFDSASLLATRVAGNGFAPAMGAAEPHRSRERGMTLLEMTIVLVVMGVLVAMSVPSVSSYVASNRLAGARNTLMIDMRYARALANAQRQSYQLRPTTTGYKLVSLNPAATVLSRTMPTDITITAVDSSTFFAWGISQPTAITMRLGSRTEVVRLTSAGQVTHD